MLHIAIVYALTGILFFLPFDGHSFSSTSSDSVSTSLASIKFPFNSGGELASLSSASSSSNLSLESLDALNASTQSNIDFFKSMGYLISGSESVQILSFNSDMLKEAKPSGISSQNNNFELYGKGFKLTERRQSIFSESTNFIFRSEDGSNVVLLNRNTSSDTISGRAEIDGKYFSIVPALNTDAHRIVDRSLSVELKLGKFEEVRANDFGDSPSSNNATTCKDDTNTGANSIDSTVSKEPIVIDQSLVLYAEYTKRAHKEVLKNNRIQNIENLLEGVSLDQLKLAFIDAGINVNVKYSQINKSKYSEPTNEIDGPLSKIVCDLATSDEKELELFRKRKRESLADIGILVVHREREEDCGHAKGINVNASNAYIVVNWQCIVSNTVPHEIGHLLGGEHIDPENTTRSPLYARAFKGSKFVTVMGRPTSLGCRDDCPRTRRFSSPTGTYLGEPIGNKDTADNARAILMGVQRSINFGEELSGNIVQKGDQQISQDSADVRFYNSSSEAYHEDLNELQKRRLELSNSEDMFLKKKCKTKASEVCSTLSKKYFLDADYVLEALAATDGLLHPDKYMSVLSSRNQLNNLQQKYFDSLNEFREGDANFDDDFNSAFEYFHQFLIENISNSIKSIQPEVIESIRYRYSLSPYFSEILDSFSSETIN